LMSGMVMLLFLIVQDSHQTLALPAPHEPSLRGVRIFVH
jgi:hypothetical protein